MQVSVQHAASSCSCGQNVEHTRAKGLLKLPLLHLQHVLFTASLIELAIALRETKLLGFICIHKAMTLL